MVSSSLKISTIISILLLIYAFHVGVGVEMPFINIVGNFGIGDLAIIVLTIIHLTKTAGISQKVLIPALIPIIIGVISLISWFISELYSGYSVNAFGYLFRWFWYGLIIIIVSRSIFEYSTIYRCFIFILLGNILMVSLVWISWYEAPSYYFGLPSVGRTDYFNSNSVAYYSTLALPNIWLIYQSKIRKLHKFILIVAALVFVITIALTFSKAGWGMLVILYALFLYKVLLSKRIKAIKKLFLLLPIFFVIFYSFTIVGTIEGRVDGSKSSNTQRVEMINHAFNNAIENPILGSGPKSFSYIGHDLFNWKSIDPHNAYAQISSDTGFLSLALYILFLLIFMKYIFSLRRTKLNFLIGPYLGYLFVYISMGFVTGLTVYDKSMWFVFALLFSTVQYLKLHSSGISKKTFFYKLSKENHEI
jgi:O-antigen ligase